MHKPAARVSLPRRRIDPMPGDRPRTNQGRRFKVLSVNQTLAPGEAWRADQVGCCRGEPARVEKRQRPYRDERRPTSAAVSRWAARLAHCEIGCDPSAALLDRRLLRPRCGLRRKDRRVDRAGRCRGEARTSGKAAASVSRSAPSQPHTRRRSRYGQRGWITARSAAIPALPYSTGGCCGLDMGSAVGPQ